MTGETPLGLTLAASLAFTLAAAGYSDSIPLSDRRALPGVEVGEGRALARFDLGRAGAGALPWSTPAHRPALLTPGGALQCLPNAAAWSRAKSLMLRAGLPVRSFTAAVTCDSQPRAYEVK